MLSTNTPLSSRIYGVNQVTPKMSSNLRAVHNRDEARHCVDPSLFPGAHHDEDRGQQRNRHLTLGRKAEQEEVLWQPSRARLRYGRYHPSMQGLGLCWPTQQFSELNLRQMKPSSTLYTSSSSHHAGSHRLSTSLSAACQLDHST